MENLIGQVLNDRYEIIEVIGSGGMSNVYRAHDSVDDRDVAVKVLKQEFVSQPKFRKRFLNESKAIAMLSHKNIVKVYDVNFEGDLQFIVMECIEGRTLKEYINDYAPLDPQEALAYCGQVLSALKHAHERGVVHRDIKPQNIMLLDSGLIKVTDFGIAHVSNFETITMTDNAIGSVHYISPEQAKGHTTDERSDLYSVGVMLYEMVTGKLPFESDTAVSVALMQVQNEPKLPSEINPELPKPVESIIMKSMQKDVSLRYQNAKEMQKDILAYLSDPTVTFDYPLTTRPAGDGATIVIPAVNEVSPLRNAAEKKEKPKKVRRDYTPEELEAHRKKAYRRIYRNRFFVALAGILLAAAVVMVGIGAMFTVIKNFTGNLIDIPNLVGQSVSEAESNPVVKSSFTLHKEVQYDDTVGEGIIISQTPESGSYEEGKEIRIVVSGGPRMVPVPKIEGLTAQEAMVQLKESDLYYEKITQSSTTVREGTVIRCDPEALTSVPVGTTVKIYVAVDTSVKKVKVPGVIGLDQQAAMKRLTEYSLLPVLQDGYSNRYDVGVVYAQSIAEDTETDSNTEVILYVSLGPDPTVTYEPEVPEVPVIPEEGTDEYYDYLHSLIAQGLIG